MDQLTLELLDLTVQPAFAVEGRTVTKVNNAAARLLIRVGTSLDQLLRTGSDEYDAFTEGTMFVTLDLLGTPWGASVTRTGIGNVFLMDQPSDSTALHLLALAARELRGPLSDAMIAAQQTADSEDPAMQETAARLNRTLFRLLRLVGNMSDAAGISPLSSQQEYNMEALFREIFDKAAFYAASAGFTLTYEGLQEEVSSLADAQQLERTVLNLISNAMKFSPKGSTIRCQLTRRGSFLSLQVTDNGSGIPSELLPTVFQRHLRQPTIEDGRCGIGLGLLLVRSTAASHGGVVLIDQPEGSGTRVTVTLAIRSGTQGVRSPIQIDYAGERDHALVEFSDCLPPSAYYDV